MHREQPVSTTHQMYLKVLYRLSFDHPVGRVRDIAKELGVTPGTVSTGLNRLQETGFVERERYGGVQLTPPGTAIARCITRRFEVLKTLLTEVFGVDGETAELDACSMEHAVSPVTVNRMESLIERLRAGDSIDLETLANLNRTVGSRCAECAAVGMCQAAANVATDPTSDGN
jgi:DtxR family Mn-dependent transcriptional regulator